MKVMLIKSGEINSKEINDGGKESAAYQLLRIMGYASEFHTRILKLLGGNSRSWNNILKRMCEERRYIDEEGNVYDNIKMFRIIGKGREKTVLLNEGDAQLEIMQQIGIYETYMLNSSTDPLHKNIFTRKKNHRLAEICYVLEKHGISVTYENKAKLGERIGLIKRNTEVFYTSREIKKYRNEKYSVDVNIAYGKYCGVLITGERLYTIYYLEKQKRIVWNRSSELRTKVLIDETMKANVSPDFPIGKESKSARSIIFVRDDLIVEVLLSDDDEYKSFSVDSTYKHYHAIPLTHSSDIIKLLKRKRYIEDLQSLCFKEKDGSQIINEDHYSKIACHGITNQGAYLLLAFDYDLSMLQNFKIASEIYIHEKYMVLCFDWQVITLKSYFSEKIHIKAMKSTVIFEKLKKFDLYNRRKKS